MHIQIINGNGKHKPLSSRSSLLINGAFQLGLSETKRDAGMRSEIYITTNKTRMKTEFKQQWDAT